MAKTKREVGRPKLLHGPLVTVKFSALTHAHIQATAKVKGQSVSQVVRDCLAEAMGREWGEER